MLKKRGQGQSWSLDIILAFVVFILIIAVFYSLLSSNKEAKTKELQTEASTLSSNLDQNTGLNKDLAIIENGTVSQLNIETLYSKDYDSLRQQLGIKGDFCIYAVDQNGYLITVNNKTGFGNGNLSINDVPCGGKV